MIDLIFTLGHYQVKTNKTDYLLTFKLYNAVDIHLFIDDKKTNITGLTVADVMKQYLSLRFGFNPESDKIETQVQEFNQSFTDYKILKIENLYA